MAVMDSNKLAELRQYIRDNKLEGVEVRGRTLRIRFYFSGAQRNETLKGVEPTRANLKFATRLRATILHEIATGQFDYAAHFPNSKTAQAFSRRVQRRLFSDELDKWLSIKKASVAPATYRSYANKAEKHVRPKWGRQHLDEIRKSDIEHWVTVELHNDSKGRPYSNKTINEILIPLRGVLGNAFIDEAIGKDPMNYIRNLRVVRGKPEPFTQDEIHRLITTPTKHTPELLGFELACWTGLSVSELLALAWEDIDLEENVIHVRRANVNGQYKVPKEASRERDIDLLQPARWVLSQLRALTSVMPSHQVQVLQRDNKTVIEERIRFVVIRFRDKQPVPRDMNYRDRFFSTHCRNAGVRYRGPNNARHTFASQLLTKGVPKEWIAGQMGHTTTKMIDDHYGEWINEDAPHMGEMVSKMLGFDVPVRPSQDQKLHPLLENRYKSTG